MKDFYTVHIKIENYNTANLRTFLKRSFAVVEFLDIKEDDGRHCKEVYDYLFLDGTKEEFEAWAKHEFSYLRIKVSFL